MSKVQPADSHAVVSSSIDPPRTCAVGAASRSWVMILDEAPDEAGRYEAALMARGYRVDLARDAQTAIRLVQHHRFDVLVSSLDMGRDENGWALRAIHSLRATLPVVLLSNALAFSRARIAMECGAHRYLLRPVAADRLVEVVAETLREALRLD